MKRLSLYLHFRVGVPSDLPKALFLLLAFLASAVWSCRDSISLKPQMCDKPGRQVPDGEIPAPADVALDAYCAKVVKERSAPNGFVTIFGSARAKEGMKSYDWTRRFALLWSKKHGDRFPILTGGGPGIMEAGNRGAKEAGKASLGFSTYFGKGNEPLNSYTTDGYVFASFSQREADMVDHAIAILVAPGGVGTSWEIFETLSKVQTHKKAKVPIVLLGDRKMWQPLFSYMHSLAAMGTISPEDPKLLQWAKSPEEAVSLIEKGLEKRPRK